MSAPTSWCVHQSQCLHQHPRVFVSQCLHQHPSGPTCWCFVQSERLHQHPGVLIQHVCTNILVRSSVVTCAPTPKWTNMLVFHSVTMSAPTPTGTNMLVFCSVTMSAPTTWCVNSQCLHQHPTPHRRWAKPNGWKEHREQTPSVGALQSTTEPQPVSSAWTTLSAQRGQPGHSHSKHVKQLTTQLLQLPPLDTARQFQFSIKWPP